MTWENIFKIKGKTIWNRPLHEKSILIRIGTSRGINFLKSISYIFCNDLRNTVEKEIWLKSLGVRRAGPLEIKVMIEVLHNLDFWNLI